MLYNRWVIERHPDKCLDIFTGDEAVRTLPHIKVYEHIKSLNPDIAFKYMEQVTLLPISFCFQPKSLVLSLKYYNHVSNLIV